jgi:hypothetical protein
MINDTWFEYEYNSEEYDTSQSWYGRGYNMDRMIIYIYINIIIIMIIISIYYIFYFFKYPHSI